VFNAIDSTSVRSMMALIARSFCTIGLDSAPIYIAQALNVPAVSIWGTHAPAARIGYDKNMMDLAIWNQEACQYAPCFAYGEFPASKCPNGIRQTCCEVVASVSVDDVLKKVDAVESASAQLGKFAAKT
jgi:ADP-heptose:LPS heptosyltransferase